MNNLFSSLSKYAERQGENYLTEALVYVLRLLLDRDSQHGLEILTNFCGPETVTWLNNPGEMKISTQFTVVEGRPDKIIEIGKNAIVFIEVKHDSGLGRNQLESYCDHIQSSSYQNKQLVFMCGHIFPFMRLCQ